MSTLSPGFLHGLLACLFLLNPSCAATRPRAAVDPRPPSRGSSLGAQHANSTSTNVVRLPEPTRTNQPPTIPSTGALAMSDGGPADVGRTTGDAAAATPAIADPSQVSPDAWVLGDPPPVVDGFELIVINEQGLPEYDMVLPAHDLATTARVTMRFVLLPAGSFAMGSPEPKAPDEEQPQHIVSLPAYLIQKTEFTQLQWMHANGSNPSHRGGPDSPVNNVTHTAAQDFLAQLGLSLPSESQWEYAARAGSTGQLYGDLDAIGWYRDNRPSGEPVIVGRKEPNAFGLHDMIGNVWEWCADNCHASYFDAPADGSAWSDEGEVQHLVRGGSYLSGDRSCTVVTRRGKHATKGRGPDIGFRAVKSLTKP